MGDSYGAVIAGVEEGAYRCAAYYGEDRFCFKALVRFGGAAGAVPWRYDSAGNLDRPAQGPDGTLYAIEHIGGGRAYPPDSILPDSGDNKSLVMIDGATGQVTARVSLLPSTRRTACGITYNEPRTVGPIVGSEGDAFLLAKRRDTVLSGSCNGGVFVSYEESWTLLRVARTGQVSSVAIDACQSDAACASLLDPQQLLPDGIGGLLINGSGRLIRFDADAVRTDHAWQVGTRIALVGQAGVVYTGSGAFNVQTFTPVWAAPPGLSFVAAHPDGGMAAQNSSGELLRVGADGQIAETLSAAVLVDPVQTGSAWIGNVTGMLKAVQGDFPDATRFNLKLVSLGSGLSEPGAFGDIHGGSAQANPGKGIFLKSHWAVEYVPGIHHFSLRVVPTRQVSWIPQFPPDFATDIYGNAFFTIGAGPPGSDTGSCSGLLTKGYNRERDRDEAPSSFTPLSLAITTPGGLLVLRSEDVVIEAIRDAFANYDDDLPYACFPESNPGFFNSNSFLSGLLDAVSVPKPWIKLYAPGWVTPVPLPKFQ
jgi:hypothetical protein